MLKKNIFNTKSLVRIALISAMAAILMLFEFPIPLVAPDFYKFDFSEVIVLIAGFIMGPMVAVVVEFMKILIIFLIKGSHTAGIGEIANFIVGCSLVVPTCCIFSKYKSKYSIMVGSIVGVVSMVIIATVLNYYVMIPLYSKAFQMPLELFVDLGKEVNPYIVDLKTLIIICVFPFNLIKGCLVTFLSVILYDRVSKAIGK